METGESRMDTTGQSFNDASNDSVDLQFDALMPKRITKMLAECDECYRDSKLSKAKDTFLYQTLQQRIEMTVCGLFPMSMSALSERKMEKNRAERRKNAFDHSPKDINIRRSIVERALLSKKIPSSTPMPKLNRKLNFTPEDAAACSPIDLNKNTETSNISVRMSQSEKTKSHSKTVTRDQSNSKSGSVLEAVVAKLTEKKQNCGTTNRTVQTSNNTLVTSIRKLARKPLAQERQTQTGDSLRRLFTKSKSVKVLPLYDKLVSKANDTNTTVAHSTSFEGTGDSIMEIVEDALQADDVMTHCSSFLKTGGSVMEIVEEAHRKTTPKKRKSRDKSRENFQAPWRVPSGFDTFVGTEPQDENLDESLESLDETFVPKIKSKKKDYVKKKILVGVKTKRRSSILPLKNRRSSIRHINDREEPLQDSVPSTSTKDASQVSKTSSKKEKVATNQKEASLQNSITNRKTQRVRPSCSKDASVQCFKSPEETKTSSRKEKVQTKTREASHQDSASNREAQRTRTTSTKDASVQCIKTPVETKTSSRKEKVSTSLREDSITNRKQQKTSTEDLVKKKHEDHGTSIPRFEDRDLVGRKTRNEGTSTISNTSTVLLKSPQKTETRINEKKISKSRREELLQNSVTSSKTVSGTKKNNLLKSAEKAGPSSVVHELTFTNDQFEVDIAAPSANESVHSSKLRKRLFSSTDSETVVTKRKRNRTEEGDNPGPAEEEPINSKGIDKKRKTKSTKKIVSKAKESMPIEDLPDCGLRRSTRERKRPPPRGSVVMFGSIKQYNLLVGVNNSSVDHSIERSANISTSSLKKSTRTKSISSRVASSSAFPPILEQDEDRMEGTSKSDESIMKSVKTGRVSKKKGGRNKKSLSSSKSTIKSGNISQKTSCFSNNSPQYIPTEVSGLSIALTLENCYCCSQGYMKLDPGICKPSTSASNHSITFFVIQGVSEVEINDEIRLVKKSDSFQVPQGFQYSIKNINRRSNLILGFTRCKAK